MAIIQIPILPADRAGHIPRLPTTTTIHRIILPAVPAHLPAVAAAAEAAVVV